jgi:hypothetical protein
MNTRTRWTAFHEAIFGPRLIEGKVITAVVSDMQSIGERPTSTFAEQIQVFAKNPIIRESIVHSAMEIIGNGFFTSMNPKYTTNLPEKGSAKDVIDYWNGLVNMDEKALTVAIEIVAYGNSFLLITPTGLQVIPLGKVIRVEPNSKDVPITEAYDLILSPTYPQPKITWGSFIHFRANVTSTSAPLGTGIISGFIESYDADTPTFLDKWNSTEKNLKAGAAKFMNPNEVWSFPEVSDEEITNSTIGLASKMNHLPESGGRTTVNTPCTVTTSQTRRDTGWDSYIQMNFDMFIMALGNPSLKASIESGFTEASIRGSIELFRKKVQSYRRVIKRLLEKTWMTVLREYGYDPVQAQVKCNFGSDEKDWTTQDLLSAQNANIITKEEARAMLREKCHWKLEEQIPTELNRSQGEVP